MFSLRHLRSPGGPIGGPVHACKGRVVAVMGLKTCVLFHSSCLSGALFPQRCCAVSHAGKVPFPSISGRLQRSVIREINGTGPISCLVPFESAKLLRTSKKMSQFIVGFIVLIVQMSNNQTHVFTQKHCTVTLYMHTYKYTGSEPAGQSVTAWLARAFYWWHHGFGCKCLHCWPAATSLYLIQIMPLKSACWSVWLVDDIY